MIQIKQPFLALPSIQIWWPDNADCVHSLLQSAPTISAMQCSDEVARVLSAYAFRQKLVCTLLIDLSQSEEELRRQLHPKSCRYKINKAEKMSCRILINDDLGSAYQLINDSIKRKKYTGPISEQTWKHKLEHSEVFLLEYAGQPLVAHVNLVDYPTHARLLVSATAETTDVTMDRTVGMLNRFLHWFEFKHYKSRGFQYYDFGGIVLDPSDSPLWSISQFKLSFGGTIVKQNVLRLAASPSLRGLLRRTAGLKQLLYQPRFLPTLLQRWR